MCPPDSTKFKHSPPVAVDVVVEVVVVEVVVVLLVVDLVVVFKVVGFFVVVFIVVFVVDVVVVFVVVVVLTVDGRGPLQGEANSPFIMDEKVGLLLMAFSWYLYLTAQWVTF